MFINRSRVKAAKETQYKIFSFNRNDTHELCTSCRLQLLYVEDTVVRIDP
jgi:hypothetical protein